MWPIRRKRNPNGIPDERVESAKSASSNPADHRLEAGATQVGAGVTRATKAGGTPSIETRTKSPGEHDVAAVEPVTASLDRQQGEALLSLARQVIQQALRAANSTVDEATNESIRVVATEVGGHFGGVFVTLWNGAALRGCIGSFQPTDDIASYVAEVARSALDDPRFRDKPIRPDELDHLTVEISVLSDLVRTGDPLSLVPGTHGVLIRRGEQSGCFLPKVATERGWSAEEFLSYCCTTKADLPADAWRDQAVEVYLFTAESFRDVPPGVGQV